MAKRELSPSEPPFYTAALAQSALVRFGYLVKD